ncbi:50S ribosomal protein L1 [Salvia divinorum]|uniref:CL1 n=1 Tax=Salvia divinorum TaxID=28513 RepID=A0ABD1I392_SALDI
MAAFKPLLSRGYRLHNPPPTPCHLVTLLCRHFSSEPLPTPSPEPQPSSQPNANFRNPVPIQPVSYPAKPQAPPTEETQPEYIPGRPLRNSEGQQEREMPNVERRSWSRDEMRYMKDGPTISTVSYAARVAPLPEDRENVREEEKGGRFEEMEVERRRIDEFRRRGGLRYGGMEVREEVNLPFPQLIRVENADKKAEEKSKAVYDVKEAIRLVKTNARKTFEETLEAHVRMTRDLVRTDLKLDGSVRLPHGAGKTYRVAVFAEGASADEAREAGADVVGGPELVESIVAGKVKMDIDKCIATPPMIKHLRKIARYLKKLMPDTKKGTLTNDISRAVKEAKESVPFEKDKTAIVHVPLGKVKFPENSLKENIGAFVHALLLAKPAGLKKSSKFAGYVDTFHITSTMGRSYPVSIQSLAMAADQFSKTQVK